MAQPSVANYFNTKKRPIVEDVKLNNARKVLILDEDALKPTGPAFVESQITCKDVKNKIKSVQKITTPTKTARKVKTPRSSKIKPVANQGDIRTFLNSIGVGSNNCDDLSELNRASVPENNSDKIPSKIIDATPSVVNIDCVDSKPSTASNKQSNAKEKTNPKRTEPTLTEIAQKLCRSSRLAEIRASLARFQECEQKLEAAKQKTQQTKDALTLKNFKTIELEINLSPQKLKSPEKPYLSPKKDIQGARKNLFGLPSPVKQEIPISTIKHSLSLPYKYRCLAEVFRSIDTVCQILHNRKETITYKKLKQAVEEMLKRNFSEKHLAQIKHLYPEAFLLRREKLREFGTGLQNDRWELVIVPQLQRDEQLNSETLLERRRKLYNILIEKVKDYHQEFLASLDSPMVIDRCKITRWHPLFDIESIPDIESAVLPSQPEEEKFCTGHEVLQKAREMFHCNTRMERALERLQEASQNNTAPEPPPEVSMLKGIPKALLEKIRQKQAAKALESMTRSASKDKEVQLYSNLPEIARLTRNLFVTEKKSILPLDLVLDKLCNSYRTFLKRSDMEIYLRTISKEINGWLVFHEIRGEFYVKLLKNSDLSVVMNKLQQLASLKDS